MPCYTTVNLTFVIPAVYIKDTLTLSPLFAEQDARLLGNESNVLCDCRSTGDARVAPAPTDSTQLLASCDPPRKCDVLNLQSDCPDLRQRHCGLSPSMQRMR